MDALNEMTALNASVGAEAGQPFTKSNTTIINDNDSDFNRFDEINDLCDIDESYLHTVSMTELFDSAYQSKPPIIDGLLYRGNISFRRLAEDWQELSDGTACLPRQHRHKAVGL